MRTVTTRAWRFASNGRRAVSSFSGSGGGGGIGGGGGSSGGGGGGSSSSSSNSRATRGPPAQRHIPSLRQSRAARAKPQHASATIVVVGRSGAHRRPGRTSLAVSRKTCALTTDACRSGSSLPLAPKKSFEVCFVGEVFNFRESPFIIPYMYIVLIQDRQVEPKARRARGGLLSVGDSSGVINF